MIMHIGVRDVETRRRHLALGTIIISGCEPPPMSFGNQSQVFYKHSTCSKLQAISPAC